MKFTFFENADARFSYETFKAKWVEWDVENQEYRPTTKRETLAIWTDYGWSTFTHDYREFGTLDEGR